MKRIDTLRSFKLEFVASIPVRQKIIAEVEDKIFSWGNGYHDAWVALYDAIEE